MARVLVKLRIFPESIDLDLKELAKHISEHLPENSRIEGVGEEPIAFGLNALLLLISMPDEEGFMNEVEEAIRATQGVNEIQIISVSRAR
ncbi:elongation factor 1-beta [Candidatus Bathyarchaeota archaeon]|nr:elongation factor 1-beta [Candidatus Bathyarchaeota archaeon]MBS7613625.1 elongation factor 1-beta [Candidatus Bathyarchaeota archaeon]MBS7617108.1 elongation factor 1-beta [Candidatus Bathyarchaeota archaeon]